MALRRIFLGFCINRFGIGPLHYVSIRSDFSFEFSEIFVIENRLPDSPSQESGSRRLPDSSDSPTSVGSRGLSDSPSFLLNIQKPSRRVSDSPTRGVGESFFDYEYLRESPCKGSLRNQFLQKPQKIRLIAMSL